jgi:hypothetical protein
MISYLLLAIVFLEAVMIAAISLASRRSGNTRSSFIKFPSIISSIQ